MNYTEKVFEMLKLKPNQNFRIPEFSNWGVYKIDNYLRLYVFTDQKGWALSEFDLISILKGDLSIGEKAPSISEKEYTILKYWYYKGYKTFKLSKDNFLILTNKDKLEIMPTNDRILSLEPKAEECSLKTLIEEYEKCSLIP